MLPWLQAPLQQVLERHRGHALLVQGAAGVGTWPFLLAVAQAWLCEGPGQGRAPACGRCGSCQLVNNRVHPDLFVLLPETLRRSEAWPLADDEAGGDDAKKKPSKQIRADELRWLIGATTRTSGRGRGKVALIHPAEAMNATSANALLKTLEEPSEGTRLLLGTADDALLLPTVRSRCQVQRLAAPAHDAALAWLAGQGLDDAAAAGVLLAATGGRPLEVLRLREAGVDAAAWQQLPRAVAAGQARAFAGWAVPMVIDALQKLCHDALARSRGAPPRYFPAASLGPIADAQALLGWWMELQRAARHDEHPWNEPLLLEALIGAGASALRAASAGQSTTSPAARRGGGGPASGSLRYTAAS